MKVREEDARRLRMGKEFVTGAIIGKAEIFGVKRYETRTEVEKDCRSHLASKALHGTRYGFLLRNARMFRLPVPYKGQLGFFEASLPEKAAGDFPRADITDG